VKALEEDQTSGANGTKHVLNWVYSIGTSVYYPIAREERFLRKFESILSKALKR
jgi:hypothetical protein